jgi:DNA-binding response OmpR family regulator
VVAAAPRVPIIGVIEEVMAPEIDEDWAIVQFVLAGAGPAEIDARLRLAQWFRVPEAESDPAVLTVGPFVLDVLAYSVAVDGATLRLTHHEFELLKALLKHAGRPLTRLQLLAECKGWTDDTSPRAVDCHVHAIRAKLGAHRDAIRTVRGQGYLLLGPSRRREVT